MSVCRAMVVVISLLASACMPGMEYELSSLAERQPMVTAVQPAGDALVAAEAPVALMFSVPLDADSIDATSIAVVEKPADFKADELAEAVLEGDVQSREGVRIVSDDGMQVTFGAATPYPAGREYVVVVTSGARSLERVPFNQSPGEEPTPFVSAFRVGGVSADGVGDGGGGSAGGGEAAAIPKIRPSWLVISEVLYDVPGADTNGDVFVELAGEASTEISGYELAFVNGSDGKIYDTIGFPEGSFLPDDGIFVVADAVTGSPGTSHIEAADYIVNFDPQNGPDAVQLIDAEGALVDVVGYGSPISAVSEEGLAAYEGSPAVDVSSGMSIARVDTFDTDDNSLDFVQQETPSPGVVELFVE